MAFFFRFDQAMKQILEYILILFVFFGGTACNTTQTKVDNAPYVNMLSMDAFRWDYPDMYPTPNLDKIAQNGVKAKSLKPCFPTKTFPNHYSIATGLYPDNHGIVMNSFYDPEMDAYYRIGNREAVENPAFYEGEPIWETAEKQGVKTASFFWVGSETAINGIQPSIWKRYEHQFPFEQRLDSVVAWLQLPEEKRPHLIMWYMHEPDKVGHDFGPFAEETRNKVIYLDSLVGVFCEKIQQLPNADKINLIFIADHGMCPISPERVVNLKNYINEEWVDEVQGGNPVWAIDAKEGFEDEVYSALQSIEHIQSWKHGELPERLHYGTHLRTLDFVVVSDSAWSVSWGRDEYASLGTHGYDNDNTDMHAIFYAYGPAFKTNYVHPTFINIDLYPLIANILDLEPAQVDGTFDNVKDLLRNDKMNSN